jgi:restriction endonuclease S subunit
MPIRNSLPRSQSRFVEMFGDPSANTKRWKIQRLDEFSENLDFRRKPITASERVKGKYPYYGASGIVDYVEDYIFDDNILLISEDGANLLMRSSPVAFSVHGKVWVNNHAHVYKFTNMCIQKYIEIYFSMIDISDQITGSAQPKLNQAKLNAMKFAIPDKIYLDRYYKFVCHIDKSKLSTENSRKMIQNVIKYREK